ncbi:NUDIX hydrolase [Polaribacter sp.]|uniref:NUDIX hydrolase n=1 Tax=Polaribacter sp. TaxID=1920175 RepID=UPI003EFAD57C
MYNVFVNDTPIIITSSLKKINNFPVYLLKDVVIEEIVYKLQHEKINGIILFSDNLEKDWVYFLKNFKVIAAAGGLVLNANEDILFIFRNGIWDLPKGRIEKGEAIETAAIREVEEECGIANLTIIQPLITTYHIFFQNGMKLKKTYWFLMTSDYDKKLTPQTEEGITKVAFKNEVDVTKALKNTYGNIKIVYNTYKELP